MKKKILITSTDIMMLQFLIPHVFNLLNEGYDVEVACSEVDNRIEELKKTFNGKINLTKISLKRNPLKIENIKGLVELIKLMYKNRYDILWTNEPVMGLMSRLAARLSLGKSIKVIYFAHGFHFFKGASKKNWLLFYPLEKIFSYLTDVLITINNEDFLLASKKFKHPIVFKLPGIGINVEKFKSDMTELEKINKRRELSVEEDEKLIIIVSELEERKNLVTAIKAFDKANLDKTKMIVCGIGSQYDNLSKLIDELGLADKVSLLGYRYDIKELCTISDLFLFTTFQEGLSVALMEAMYIGLPCLVSEIRGNVDLIEFDKGLYCNPHDISSCASSLKEFFDNPVKWKNSIKYNQNKINEYDINKVKKLIVEIINEL